MLLAFLNNATIFAYYNIDWLRGFHNIVTSDYSCQHAPSYYKMFLDISSKRALLLLVKKTSMVLNRIIYMEKGGRIRSLHYSRYIAEFI